MKMSEQREAQACAGRCGAEKSNVMNPFVDWSFKYLFGTERSKKNLIGFLNLLLDLENIGGFLLCCGDLCDIL